MGLFMCGLYNVDVCFVDFVMCVYAYVCIM